MQFGTARRVRTVLVSLGFCAAAAFAPRAGIAGGAPTSEGLAAAAKAAKAAFRPIDRSDVEESKAALLEALDRLDGRLGQAGPNGDDWRKWLLWDQLQDQLSSERQPDKAVLRRVLTRYRPDHDGLELVWFLDVQRALHNYLAMLGAVDNPAVKNEFEERMDRLAKTLEEYQVKPTTEDAVVISETVRFLQGAHQTPRLVRAIERELVHPNVIVDLSPQLVGAGLVECVDDTMPVEDCILGTAIYGMARTVGQTHTELVPSRNVGILDTIFCGVTHSNNIGYHGNITICSTATVDLVARKRLCINAEGLWTEPAVSSATVSTDIGDIQSRKGRRMIERMAWKKSDKLKPEAECIAARHAESRLNQRIDERAEDPLEQANQKYVEKFYRPFSERKLFPQTLRFSTMPQAFTITAVQAGGGKVAAPSAPPAVAAEGSDMTLRLHESMINNLAFDALAGRTIHEKKVQTMAVDLLGYLPDRMKGDDDGKPWAITFAPRQPVSVTFADNGFRVTLRGARYFKGEDAYPAMNISAIYKIDRSVEGKIKVVRQGGIEVFPPGFVPGGEKKLSGPQQVLRKLLEKRFAKVFEPEFLGEGLTLPGKWKSFGKLLAAGVTCDDGWLSVAWKRAAVSPKVAAAK
ncbi:MAG: hypothetical protein LLG00_13945 [Planctomycetaceae bacterium]|nr:hypothetical protein [Planctomycetaceae bacterium]